MLSAGLLSSLREFIEQNYRPEPKIKMRKAAAAPAFFSVSAKSTEDTADCAAPLSAQPLPEYDLLPDMAAAVCEGVCEADSDGDYYSDSLNLNLIRKYVDENRNPTFSSELMRLIDESGCRDSEIYSRAGIDRRHFSKIRSNPDYHPGKQTAVALCLALKLDRQQSEQLLSAAGYSLSSSEIFDLIIIFCLENRIYDLSDVNTALVYFSLKPIGAAE